MELAEFFNLSFLEKLDFISSVINEAICYFDSIQNERAVIDEINDLSLFLEENFKVFNSDSILRTEISSSSLFHICSKGILEVCPLIRSGQAHYSYLVEDLKSLSDAIMEIFPRNERLARFFLFMLDNQDKIIKEINVTEEDYNKVITELFNNSDNIDKIMKDTGYRQR